MSIEYDKEEHDGIIIGASFAALFLLVLFAILITIDLIYK